MIKLFGRHTSNNVQKVLWFLEELELEFEHIELGGEYGGANTEEFAKINPLKRVPVLIDGDQVIWESNTILRYLLLTHETSRWKAGDPYQRSNYERWMDWSIDRLEPVYVGVFWGYYRTPEKSRDMAEINQQVIKYNEYLETMNSALSNQKYLCGNEITLADIALGVYIFRLVEINVGIKLSSNISNWYKELTQRDGYRRWVMSDFSQLKGSSVGF